MTQNLYDDAGFFAVYSQLPRSIEGLAGAPEWPALCALLPELGGLQVPDLGCGFGWFSRWAREHGAASVVGIDVPERMLGRAKAETLDTAISYVRADLERVELASGTFDVAYSSLALHYLENLEGLIARVHDALVPGGRLIFSVEHPIVTAPAHPGWSADAEGRKTWPVNGYLAEGARATDWLTKGVIKQHRTIATYVNMLLHCGFALSHLDEWAPTAEQIAAQPLWADERQRPPFLLMACDRPKT